MTKQPPSTKESVNELPLSLDWSRYADAGMGDAYADIPKRGGDFAKAIAVCINSGQCETDNKLVMCPSFKVSGDPALSTGGRVRQLKAALSAPDWETALEQPELARAMGLCIACKGCKRECDNSVDMALIKSEYLAWRAQRNGVNLRSRLFAYFPQLLWRAPWLRHLIRWRNHSQWLRSLGARWLALDVAASLPQPTAAAAPRAYATTRNHPAEECPETTVVLFIDTFSHHFDPTISAATHVVLEAGGYHVIEAVAPATDATPTRPLCCGRTFLAQGLVAQARAEIERLVSALYPYAAANLPIVGLEASCVLGLRDDALALGLPANQQEQLALIAKQTLMLEEFLAREIMAKKLNLPWQTDAPQRELLIHGHCHQKAVGAMKAVRRVLKQIPDLNFTMIEAGCCGMAGTFGLEAEHQTMSNQLAQSDLMPALAANPHAEVMANGFSCRQQMVNQGDTRARHLALILRDAIVVD